MGQGTGRIYENDRLGRITRITDDVFGNATYTYDYLGRLSSDNGQTIVYDTNGNITNLCGTTMTYDPTIKSKLLSVAGQTVYYIASQPWLIDAVGNKTFYYNGQKLNRIGIGSSTYYNYTYNHLGQRISKTGPDGTIQFVYDGDKLIAEIAPSHRLDFLYDENGKLYGFVKDSVDKYFYIRDSLGNILGVLDDYSNIVAKYSYTAFGEVTIPYSTSDIANLNPFRYKGYYYDTESQMYCIDGMYYIPTWGRWLTPKTCDQLSYYNISRFNPFTKELVLTTKIERQDYASQYLLLTGEPKRPNKFGNDKVGNKLVSSYNAQTGFAGAQSTQYEKTALELFDPTSKKYGWGKYSNTGLWPGGGAGYFIAKGDLTGLLIGMYMW